LFFLTCLMALVRFSGDIIHSNRFPSVGCTVTREFSLIHMKIWDQRIGGVGIATRIFPKIHE